MTSRMQITLDPSLRQQVARQAEKQGVSIAEYVRRTLERDAQPLGQKPDVTQLFDLGSSQGVSDIANAKNSMIAESLSSKLRR